MRSAICLAFLFFVFAMTQPVSAAGRVALVVGIDSYDNLPLTQQLKKAVNDAHAVGEALKGLGYQVVRANNVDRRAFNENWQRFLSLIDPGDSTAFFFAGHGIEMGGQNYLLPRDVPKPQSGEEPLIKNESVSVSQLLGDLQEKGPRVSLVILDACRDNPFAASGVRSVGGTRGLARVEAPEGTFVMYSAGAGQTALDRLSDTDGDANSVFTRSLVPLIKTPGLPLQEVALKVRERVVELANAAGHKQTPAYYDQVIGRFCVAGCEAAETPGVSQAAKKPKVGLIVPPEVPATPPKPIEPAVGVFPKPDAGSIELDALIQLYMLPAGISENIDWYTGSNAGTPISWEHAGVKDCEPYLEKEFGTTYCRTGTVVITARGSPIYTVLGKTVEPGRWVLTMMGSRAGVSHVSIYCNCLRDELGGGTLVATASKAANGLEVTSMKRCGYAGDGSELFRITSLGRQPAFVRETWSCGSGGCGVDFVLTSIEEEAEKLLVSECNASQIDPR